MKSHPFRSKLNILFTLLLIAVPFSDLRAKVEIYPQLTMPIGAATNRAGQMYRGSDSVSDHCRTKSLSVREISLSIFNPTHNAVFGVLRDSFHPFFLGFPIDVDIRSQWGDEGVWENLVTATERETGLFPFKTRIQLDENCGEFSKKTIGKMGSDTNS